MDYAVCVESEFQNLNPTSAPPIYVLGILIITQQRNPCFVTGFDGCQWFTKSMNRIIILVKNIAHSR